MPFGRSVALSLATLTMFGQTEIVLPPPVSRSVSFAADVEPILKSKCNACHGAAQQMSGLRLDNRNAAITGGYSGAAIVPGDSAGSKLIQRVAGAPGVLAMPPAGPKLSADEVGILRSWIDRGAEWTHNAAAPEVVTKARHPHWAFQPVHAKPEPQTKRGDWARNAIDRFVLARLEKDGIEPSPEAAKRTLLRRVSFDLVGLPPTPEQTRAFLEDTGADAYERAVDRLLASPHFGERWARPWLDRARYADSDGYEKDWVRPHAWRYRQWVIDALNADMPFDRFTVAQIAGDQLTGGSLNDRIATGFHRQTLTNREGGVDNNQFLFEAAVDRTNTVSSTWLGLTAGCAQCHDHKYDPISQKDYYQLYSFFENLEEVDVDAPMPGEVGPYLRTRDEYLAKRAALLEEYNVAALQADWEIQMLDAASNPGKRTDWDLAWDCLLKLTESGDGEKILRIPPSQRTARERDILTDHFVRNFHFAVGQKRFKDLKLDEADKKLRSLKAEYPQLSQAMVVADAPQATRHHLRVRGDYRTLGIEVSPNTPAVLPPLDVKKPKRLDLARWIVSPENPLTARVTVNWIWQEVFGRGLVRTSDDFGTRGEKPSHPELLDLLAYRFMNEGWSMKRLIRSLVTSATYRQSSKARPELQDPENALLARHSRNRLPAELIRDAALHAGGLLVLNEVGGRSVRPPQPAGVASIAYAAKDDGSWVESKGLDRYRRGLYVHFQRATPYPLLMNFDAPKSVVTQCRRERSNSPLQALNLLNDPVFVEAAVALAHRSVVEADDLDGRIAVMFEAALARPPSAPELKRFKEVHSQLLGKFDRDAAAAAELAPAAVPTVSRADAASLAILATALLNLDEFITKE